MAKITAADARRLGIKTPAKQLNSKRSQGRTRADRIQHDEAPISITVPLADDPKPKERPRTVVDMKFLENAFMSARGNLPKFKSTISGRLSRTFTPQQTVDYENVIREAAQIAMIGRKALKCPVESHITFVLKGGAEEWPTSRRDGDADNMEKAVLDALNGLVFEDDSLVVRSYREKICGDRPEVRILIRPAQP